MEGEKEITQEPIKNQEETREEIKKAGAVAIAVLSAFINSAEVQAGYNPPTTPDAEHTQTIPKSDQEKVIPADPILHSKMTPEQIDNVAKGAMEKYEMEKSFQEVLKECNTIENTSLYNTKDTLFEKTSEACVNWYKTEVSKGNEKQAIEILLQNYKDAKNTKIGVVGMTIAAIAVASSVFGWEILDAKKLDERIKASEQRNKERENKQKMFATG